jgi:hypothetical protein
VLVRTVGAEDLSSCGEAISSTPGDVSITIRPYDRIDRLWFPPDLNAPFPAPGDSDLAQWIMIALPQALPVDTVQIAWAAP